MVQSYAIDLVSDENAEKRDGSRIGPQFAPQQPDRKEYIRRAVCEQVNTAEYFCSFRDAVHAVSEHVRKNIMAVYNQPLLRNEQDNPNNGTRLYGKNENSADYFEKAVDSFYPDAEAEHAVEKPVHSLFVSLLPALLSGLNGCSSSCLS